MIFAARIARSMASSLVKVPFRRLGLFVNQAVKLGDDLVYSCHGHLPVKSMPRRAEISSGIAC